MEFKNVSELVSYLFNENIEVYAEYKDGEVIGIQAGNLRIKEGVLTVFTPETYFDCCPNAYDTLYVGIVDDCLMIELTKNNKKVSLLRAKVKKVS